MGITVSQLQKMSGLKDIEEDKNLREISRYFNTVTTRGRACVSVVTIAFYVIVLVPLSLRKETNTNKEP